MYLYKIYMIDSTGMRKDVEYLEYSDHLTSEENNERAQMLVDSLQKKNPQEEYGFKRTLVPGI